MKNIRADKVLRFTMLFHDMGKPSMKTTDEKGVDHFEGHALVSEEIARKVLRRLKFDNETVRQVTRLVCYHDYRAAATPRNVRRAMNRIGVDLFPLYLEVRMADVKAQSNYQRSRKDPEHSGYAGNLSADPERSGMRDLEAAGGDRKRSDGTWNGAGQRTWRHA